MLQDIKFAPTMVANNTPYAAKGSWRVGDKVRFRGGFPETIGGWVRRNQNTFRGTCRALTAWRVLAGDLVIGVGTNVKYYLEQGAAFNDITPLRSTAVLTNPFTTISTTLAMPLTADATEISLANGALFPQSGFVKIGMEEIFYSMRTGSTLQGVTRGANNTVAAPQSAGATVFVRALLVTDTDHGATMGDYVVFSGATAVGGVPAVVLNTEHEVVEVRSLNEYYIAIGVYPTSGVVGGGPTVTAQYQINTGLATFVQGTGFGAGGFGDFGFGLAADGGIGAQLRIWNHQNFGEDLVFGPRGGPVYYWDATNGVTTRGVLLSTQIGASNVPVVQNQLLVTESRFLLAFGANPIGSTIIDPMLIRWSDQELIQDWTPTATNLAGDLRLAIGSEIITAVQTRQEILVWTDAALYSLQFNEGTAFTQTLLSDNISISGPNAVIAANNNVYWMGKDKFYVYSGRAGTLQSTVDDYVFEDFNADQEFQVYAGVNEAFDEVWWFYPSSTSMQNDRYVTYNYVENGWTVGNMPRSAWLGSGVLSTPVGANAGRLFDHEVGVDDGTGEMEEPLQSYIESSDFSIGPGDEYAFVRRMLPDVDYSRSTAPIPTIQMTLKPRVASGAAYRPEGSTPAVTRSAVVPVPLYTEQVWVRLRGRQMKFRVEANNLGTAWRLGVPRIDIQADGGRA